MTSNSSRLDLAHFQRNRPVSDIRAPLKRSLTVVEADIQSFARLSGEYDSAQVVAVEKPRPGVSRNAR
jgi:hypothetical protein